MPYQAVVQSTIVATAATAADALAQAVALGYPANMVFLRFSPPAGVVRA